MERTLNFTAKSIHSLVPTAGKQIDYFDKNLSGFGIRVSSRGRKSWVLFYRFKGRFRRFTLGRYPHLSLVDARERAKDLLRDVAHEVDPAAIKRREREAETFAELAQGYLTRYARLKKRSHDEDERLIERELLPKWRSIKAKDISKWQVRELLNSVVDRGAPIQANRILALTRKMFNFAIDEDLLEANPCWGIKAPAPEHQRDRVLNGDEIQKVWGALEDEHRNIQLYFKMILLTAQRPGEVLGMRWDELALQESWWTIPRERAKNKLSHRVPLSRTAKLLLMEQRLVVGASPWVLPSRVTDRPIENIKKALDRVRLATGVDFISRDLRRTAASHMTGMGIQRLIVSKILNHKEKGITAVYDRHSYDAEKRDALERWAVRLQEILSVSPAQIAQAN